MRRLILSSLAAHRGRMALTLIAITLSVSFVTASFVLADSLRTVFDGVSTEIYSEVDAAIQSGEGEFDRVSSGERFSESDLDRVAGIDGVDQVIPGIGAEFALFTIDADGDTLRPQGPPVLNFSIEPDPTDAAALSAAAPFSLISGVAPGPGEIMLDVAQADVLEVGLGDTVRVATADGPESFTLSGTVIFGEEQSGVSPYFLLFDLETTQRLVGAPGMLDGAALILEDRANAEKVFAEIEAVLPGSLFITDQAQLIADQNSEFGQIIDVIQIALLAFAAITTFVAIFVIANTFAVLVGQQMRQLGLLRAIGASSRQAGTVIVAEAAVVGVIASVLGVGLGLGAAMGITELFEAVTTGGFPEGPLELAPRTIVFAFIVGVGVTVVAAMVPARRAAKTTPMQAIHESASPVVRRSALASLLGVFAAPVGKIFGTSGRLAAMNVKRNPRRVLSTAMSMIVGLAVITSMSVVASSYRSTLTEAMTSDFDADVILAPLDGGDVPFAAVEALAALPEVEAASGFGKAEVRFGGEVIEVSSFQSSRANDVLDLGVTEGTSTLPTGDSSLVSVDFAEEHGVGVGDTVAIEFSDGFTFDSVVAGVFGDDSIISTGVLVDESVVTSHARNTDAFLGAIRFASSANEADAVNAVQATLDRFPQVEDQTVDKFLADRQAQVDQLLMLANGLLALTVVIAMSGIANTVALSVLERTNEIGLLRSVGMSRSDVRSMIRHEALITAAVGALIGVVAGVALGAVAAALAPANVISSLVIPGGQLMAFLIVGVVLGLAAALLPAFRASRLNMITAMRAS